MSNVRSIVFMLTAAVIWSGGCGEARVPGERGNEGAARADAEIGEDAMAEGIDAMLRLLREMDRVHRGRREVISLQLYDDYTLRDDDGAAVQLTRREWDGLLAQIRQGHRAAGENFYMRAAMTAYYSDGYGDLPRNYYRFRIEEPYGLVLLVSRGRPGE